MQFPLVSQRGALAPRGDPEPMAQAEWAAGPQRRFPHSPLRGARGAAPLRHSRPGLVWPEDCGVVEKLARGADTRGIQMWLLLGLRLPA